MSVSVLVSVCWNLRLSELCRPYKLFVLLCSRLPVSCISRDRFCSRKCSCRRAANQTGQRPPVDKMDRYFMLPHYGVYKKRTKASYLLGQLGEQHSLLTTRAGLRKRCGESLMKTSALLQTLNLLLLPHTHNTKQTNK